MQMTGKRPKEKGRYQSQKEVGAEVSALKFPKVHPTEADLGQDMVNM